VKRILAIDGGGIRGVIPAVVCQKIEELANQPIHELFDLIAGTSTGGILALGLAKPPSGRSGKELVDFYVALGKTVFDKPRTYRSLWRGPLYDSSRLGRVMADEFGGDRVKDALTEILVVTYDLRLRRPVLLSRRSALKMTPITS
jgi:uncharacterized protein